MFPRTKGRCVRDHEEAEALIEEWQASDQPMSDWCATRGINWRSLSGFKGKLKSRTLGDDFVEVNLTIPSPATKPARYEIHLGDGRHLSLGDNFSEVTLTRLLAVVCPC